MAILEPYIPREYLALQINYCKQQLAMLPEVSMTYHMIRGERIRIFKCKKHTIKADSPNGKELEIIYWQREELLRKLSRLDGLWNCYFRGLPPSGIAPRKIQRKLYISSTESVIIDSKFFDSLENDGNSTLFRISIRDSKRDPLSVFIDTEDDELPGFRFLRDIRGFDLHKRYGFVELSFGNDLKHTFPSFRGALRRCISNENHILI